MPRLDKVLFVSHKEKQCGVYQFGYNIGQALKKSKKYKFIYVECSSPDELNDYVHKYKPICLIYNYQGDTLPWVNSRVTFRYKIPQIGMIHEVSQKVADSTTNYPFDAYIAPDPTLILKNPIVYKTGRLLLKNRLSRKHNNIPIIGSFGFGSPNKNFDLLVKKVGSEFGKAIIRLNVSFARFGDEDGSSARKAISKCITIAKQYPKIKFEYSHDFLDQQQLLEFLNSNTLNAFLYSDKGNKGISSVIDFALSVKIPIAVSGDSCMFRHVQNAQPSIVLSDKNGFKDIIKNGIKPLGEFYNEWTEENLVWDYERIVNDVVTKVGNKRSFGYLVWSGINFLIRKLIGNLTPVNNNWSGFINDYKDIILKPNLKLDYECVNISSEKTSFNRILDNEARRLYKHSIKALYKIIPEWMGRKNKKANVQQGFVLDTVVKLSKNRRNQRIMSVGCFEDTAYGALKILGYDVVGIDPVLNYDLDTYLSKPSVKKEGFDIVFSTSVIEHVKDDSTFLKNMCALARKGGYIIFTCDFKEGYKEGDLKPGSDFRFYTKERLGYLISQADNCVLADKPKWNCPKPDFDWGMGRNKYTFASVVLRKVE
jgi:SAM-dependent methyltransferase